MSLIRLRVLLNGIPNMVPTTIRDVAWFVNNGRATDRIVFDEYLNPDVVVYMEGPAALVYNDTSVPVANRGTRNLHYRDGFRSTGQFLDSKGDGFNEDIWFQNSATGFNVEDTGAGWDVPSYGLAYQNSSNQPIRVEPVAMGGMHGKGVWLYERNNVTFSMPSQMK